MSSARANRSGNEISIQTATVIGAGTMGAAIAAHLANAGLQVHLLDMADHSPPAPADEHSSPHPRRSARELRNRIVVAGFERMRAARPPHLFAPQVAERIRLGNLDDDLAHAVGRSDWIIEAIVEQLAPKQGLMAELEQVAPPHAVISTNTSGLPIGEIVQGRSLAFRRRFLGTHFFNPPRYLHLLELIPTADTDPEVVAQMTTFATHTLGKGVVVCKDTPNFIANRMISFVISHLMEYAIANGYTVEEVDLLAGPLIGRPRSGLFRLLDVIGVDVMAQINRNLYDLIPHDEDRETLRGPLHTAVWRTLMNHGHLGVKAGQGFYQTVTDEAGRREFWTLDLQAATRGEVVYAPPHAPQFPETDAIRRAPLAQRLSALSPDGGRAGALAWQTTAQALVYAARRIPEITDSLADLDRVMRWGFL
jgi:3-hydroxyacyl-CoA dehydrogenase